MKKRIIIISLILLILGIISFCLYQVDSIRFKVSYEYINMMEYGNGKRIKVSVPYDNRIKYLKEDEVLTYLKEKTGVFYFGYNTCPWCRNIVPVLIDTIKKNNIDTIYYIDIHKLNLSKVRTELFDFLGDNLRLDENNEKVLAVPDVYFIKDGKIVGHHLGSVDSYINPYKKMTDKQKKELVNIYTNLVREMK